MKSWIYPIFIMAISLCSPNWGDAQEGPFKSPINTPQKPWSNLNFFNNPDNFQFAIVTDRTGGHRPGIFASAVQKINTLMPEFVMSVGDLVEGTNDTLVLGKQWHEFNGMINDLKVPFFYLPGNHDVNRGEGPKRDYWNKLYGHSYYHYIYKDVLFLAMDSNEGQGEQFSEKQLAYFQKVLEDNKGVRWTLVFMHHPLWTYEHESNFNKLENLLEDRKYTVFAGHQHTYRHFERKNTNYYILATTGGGSSLHGPSFGKFDHITWVTITDDGPVLANLKLDGILPHDVASPELVALSRELIKSTAFEYMVLLPDEETPKRGLAQITVKNEADIPLSLSGRFYHNHYVTPSKISIEETIAPKSEKKIVLELDNLQHYLMASLVGLDFDWVIAYEEEAAAGLELSGSLPIYIEPSKLEIMAEEYVQFTNDYQLTMKKPIEGSTIRYTLDGSEPTAQSPIYSQPLKVEKNTTIKAKLFDPRGFASLTDTSTFERINQRNGLMCAYYEYDGRSARWQRLPDFSNMTPNKITAVEGINPGEVADRRYYYATVYKGNLDFPQNGDYTFYVKSDDGSLLLIDGKKVVDNDGRHGERIIDGKVALKKGTHAIEIQYFQDRSGHLLEVWYEGPGIDKRPLPVSTFSF